MCSYLYPTFNLDQENFERALPLALSLSKKFQLPCRMWKTGDRFAISFKDKAVNYGFYYSHLHADVLHETLEKDVDFELSYESEAKFSQGKDLD